MYIYENIISKTLARALGGCTHWRVIAGLILNEKIFMAQFIPVENLATSYIGGGSNSSERKNITLDKKSKYKTNIPNPDPSVPDPKKITWIRIPNLYAKDTTCR